MDKFNAIVWHFPKMIHQLILRLTKWRLVKKRNESDEVVGYYWTRYYPYVCDVCGSGIVCYMERDVREVPPHRDQKGEFVYWEICGESRYGCEKHKPEKGKVYRLSGIG